MSDEQYCFILILFFFEVNPETRTDSPVPGQITYMGEERDAHRDLAGSQRGRDH
jgi:hypothetical protein